MSAAGVATAIARLEAIGRERALTHTESRQLAKLITTERRYAYGRRANQEARHHV